MTDMPAVRAAKPEDWNDILNMCAELHTENGVAEVDWGVVEDTIAQGINNQRAMIGVIGKTGSLEAMTYLRFSTMWYSAEPLLEELFLFVRPEYRRSANAKALLQFARESAKKLKLRLIIGVISNTKTEAKLRLYKRQLGEPVGGFFFLHSGA